MRFSLRQLEVIHAVARMGSITDAARHLGVSQPSISATLKQCTQVVGFPLFRRERGRLTASAETVALLPELDRVLENVERIGTLASELRTGSGGTVRIAATPAVAISILPAAITAFNLRHPLVKIIVETVLSVGVVDAVSGGKVDIGLVMSPEEVRGARVVDLYRADLVCVAPVGHPILRSASATPERLSQYPLVSFNRAIPLGALIDDAFRSRGVRREVAVEVGPSAMACAIVASGVGCAVVDPFVVMHYKHWPIKVMPFEPRTKIAGQLLVHADRPLARAAEAFIDTLNLALKPRRRTN